MMPTKVSFANQVFGVLQIRWARMVLVTVFLEGMAVFGALAFIPAYLHTRFDISLTGAGAILGLYGLGGLFYTMIAKRLYARLSERGLAVSGGLLLSAAFLMLASDRIWFLALPASFVAGLGFYMLHNTLQVNATQMAPSSRGTAVALFASALFLGQSIGVVAAALIIELTSTAWLFSTVAMMLPVIGFGFSCALFHRSTKLSNTPWSS